MRRLALVMGIGCALAGCSDGDLGGRDGRCDPNFYTVGDYRCSDNMVEICIAGDDPLRDPPEWMIIDDCSIPTASAAHGACVMAADETASCVRPAL